MFENVLFFLRVLKSILVEEIKELGEGCGTERERERGETKTTIHTFFY